MEIAIFRAIGILTSLGPKSIYITHNIRSCKVRFVLLVSSLLLICISLIFFMSLHSKKQ